MKLFLTIICIFFSLMSNLCYAEGLFMVQRGNSDILVLRNPLNNFYSGYLEAQRIVNYKDRDQLLLKICKGGKDFSNVSLYYKDMYFFDLNEIELNHDFKFPESKNIHWYEYRNEDWNKLMPYLQEIQQKNPKKDYLRATLVFKTQNGKIEKESIKLYLKSLIDLNNYSVETVKKIMNTVLTTPCKTDMYYQPYFTLFFPGVSYSDVKERFCYNLNAHKKNGDIDYGYYISQYAADDNFKLLGFKTVDNKGYIGRNFAWFVENNNGTYMNLTGTSDRSSFGSSGFNVLEYDMGDPIAGESFQHTFDTLLITYQALYGFKDYGFELKRCKFYETNKFNIKKITDSNLKELQDAYVKKEKLKIVAVNGVSTEKLSGLDFDIITQYKTDAKPVEFVFLNQKTKKNIVLTIKPKIVKYINDNLDYKSINLKNDIAILEKKTPLDFTYKNNIYFDIFDPYTTSKENIVYHN